jgi:hypothetical protein
MRRKIRGTRDVLQGHGAGLENIDSKLGERARVAWFDVGFESP